MASTKISAMSAASIPTGAELLPGVQSAANVKITVLQISALATTRVANSQGSNYTLDLTDYTGMKELFFTGAGAMVLTLPDNTGAAFPIGYEIPVMRTGSGSLTFAVSGSATVSYSSTQNADLGTNKQMSVKKIGTNAWLVNNGSAVITGDISIDVGGISAYAGIVPANKGGTGANNNVASVINISGNFATTFTVSATTSLALPVDGSVLSVGISDKTFASADKVQIITYNTIGAGTGLTLSSSSTAAASNTQTLFAANQSGANGTSAQTTFSISASNIKTGTTGINVALQGTATGGASNRSVRGFGPFLFGDAEYANPVTESSILGFMRKDQNAISAVYMQNATSNTAARVQLQLSNSATIATSLGLSSLPAGFTTSNILVADTGVIFCDKAAGLNIGTNATTQLSLWSNNSKRIDIGSTGNIIHTNTGGSSTVTLWTWTQGVNTGGSPTGLLFTAAAHTTLATGAEVTDVNFNSSATATIAGSTTLALNRTYRFQARTYTAASATTWTEAATVDISNAPTGGGAGPLTITSAWALRIASGHSKTFGKWVFDGTLTTTGTTGNQTISKPSGTVNIAAAGTTVTVTNTMCTASSLVVPFMMTSDTTAKSCSVVPGAGSFVITLNAAATAEVKIGFIVFN